MDREINDINNGKTNEKYEIIDCHTHMRALEDLQNLIRIMRETHIIRLNAVCLPTLLNEYLTQNLMGLLFKAQNPGAIFAFGGLNYPEGKIPEDGDEFRKQAEGFKNIGFDGIKMIEGKPNARKKIGVPLSHHIYDGFYTYMEEEGIPIIFHVGDPDSFWDIKRAPTFAVKRGWTYTDGTFPGKEQLYREVDEILEKHPHLNIIFAHFYFMGEEGIERASAFMDRWPGISFDLTPGVEMYESFSKCADEWRDFFIRYQERIIFGTDNDYGDSINIVGTVRRFLETGDAFSYWGFELKGLHLPQEVLQKIYATNFMRYVGEHPRKVNIPLCLKKTVEIKKLAESSDIYRKLIVDINFIYDNFSQLL